MQASELATPRRYTDKDYVSKVAPEIYGGAFRKDPSSIGPHTKAMHGTRNLGYLYQLLALTGWTSLPWLWSLPQPTLVLMGHDDPLVLVINGRVLARLIPNAKLRLIDDGHLFMVTRPRETAAMIEAFLIGRSVSPEGVMSANSQSDVRAVSETGGSTSIDLRPPNPKGGYDDK